MKKFMYFDVVVTIGLLVSGFIVPPTGVIHPSVLTACGILSFLSLIMLLPTILSEKRKTTLTHGNTSVTIEDLIKDSNISKEEFDSIQRFQSWLDKTYKHANFPFTDVLTQQSNISNHE